MDGRFRIRGVEEPLPFFAFRPSNLSLTSWIPGTSLQQRAIVPLFQFHHLLFHGLDGAGNLKHGLHDLTFRRFIAEIIEQRMESGDARGDLLGLGANLGNGFGAVHALEIVGTAHPAQVASMSLRIVVTCGPSYEPIDEVRRITNFSTGKLGAWLSEEFAAEGNRVQCLRGDMATWPAPRSPVEVIQFSTNDHLLARFETLENRDQVDAVLHAAALADFTVRRETSARKICSRSGELTLTLIPATKLISRLRVLFPNARIVGWKYELDGNREDVIRRGLSQIADNQTNACILNGAAYGAGFGALLSDGSCAELRGKEDLKTWVSEFLR
jgi:phosphopantothenate---cysteine ligase (CTP)